MTMSTRKILYSFVVLLSLRIGVKGPPMVDFQYGSMATQVINSHFKDTPCKALAFFSYVAQIHLNFCRKGVTILAVLVITLP